MSDVSSSAFTRASFRRARMKSGVDGGILAELLEDEILARIVLAVSLENEKCLRADRHNAVLAALALLDVHLLAVKIDVVPFEIACLKRSETAVVDDR